MAILPTGRHNVYLRHDVQTPSLQTPKNLFLELRKKYTNNENKRFIFSALDRLEEAVEESKRQNTPLNLSGADLNVYLFYEHPLNFEKVLLELYGKNAPKDPLYKAQLNGVKMALAHLEEANLEEANLKWGNLFGIFFNKANLKRANLEGINSQEADWIEAKLNDANLYKANLSWSNFTGAKLKRACLIGAKLEHARFNGANLKEAKLTEANLKEADLRGANLKGAYVMWHGEKITGEELKKYLVNEFNVTVDENTRF